MKASEFLFVKRALLCRRQDAQSRAAPPSDSDVSSEASHPSPLDSSWGQRGDAAGSRSPSRFLKKPAGGSREDRCVQVGGAKSSAPSPSFSVDSSPLSLWLFCFFFWLDLGQLSQLSSLRCFRLPSRSKPGSQASALRRLAQIESRVHGRQLGPGPRTRSPSSDPSPASRPPSSSSSSPSAGREASRSVRKKAAGSPRGGSGSLLGWSQSVDSDEEEVMKLVGDGNLSGPSSGSGAGLVPSSFIFAVRLERHFKSLILALTFRWYEKHSVSIS